jgi:hypothetical protein
MINARLILAIIQKLHTKWCNKLLGDYLCIPSGATHVEST